MDVRFDRAFASMAWLTTFDEARLINIEVSTSDHCPIWLEPFKQLHRVVNKKNCLENARTLNPMCKQIVSEC